MCPWRGAPGVMATMHIKNYKNLVIKSDFLLSKMNCFRWDATRRDLFIWASVGGLWWSTSHRRVYHAKLVIFSRINEKTRGNLATKPLPCAATDNKFTENVFCSRFPLTQFENARKAFKCQICFASFMPIIAEMFRMREWRRSDSKKDHMSMIFFRGT